MALTTARAYYGTEYLAGKVYKVPGN
jgi:hypothetical protein